jgi:hypothetical protein
MVTSSVREKEFVGRGGGGGVGRRVAGSYASGGVLGVQASTLHLREAVRAN